MSQTRVVGKRHAASLVKLRNKEGEIGKGRYKRQKKLQSQIVKGG
jgi:hypothetical protein